MPTVYIYFFKICTYRWSRYTHLDKSNIIILSGAATKLSDLVIVIISQTNPYHEDRARQLQIDLIEQMKDWSLEDKPAVFLSHKKWEDLIGAWTIFPVLRE